MESWQDLIAQSLTRPSDLAGRYSLDPSATSRVTGAFPARINPYFASLIREEGDPIWRQVVPSPAEVAPGLLAESGSPADLSARAFAKAEVMPRHDEGGCPLDRLGTLPLDPLREEEHSPTAILTHRYPDRALLLVSSSCPVLCRFCTRRRKTGHGFPTGDREIEEALGYLRSRPGVREVILSGGDPLLLSDRRLGGILRRLREVPSLRLLRLHTRVPGALPQRVTPALARLLASFHPLWVNLHFNHPRELTPEAVRACSLLADAGLPLGSQTVLLAGVNDDLPTLADLFTRLVALRIRPYYLFQMDTVRGTSHFRVPLARALELGESLRRSLSGIAVPTLAIDLPEGGGKVPLTRDRVTRRDGLTFVRNLEGKLIRYPEPG